MTTIKEMYEGIGKAVNGIGDRTYARSRPKSVDTRLGSYVVVRLPYSIRNGEMDSDGRSNYFSTTAQVELYVRDRSTSASLNGADIDALSEKLGQLMGVFPIVTENMVVSRPRVTLQADDGNGFGVAVVQARLRTR